MEKRYRAGILGATGMVGQRFVELLGSHPWFEVTALAASDRSASKPYADCCRWILNSQMPAAVRSLEVSPCEPPLDCDFVFSGLPGDVASETEIRFAAAGYPVISNASSHRMAEDVPLLIPEINPDHVRLIDVQRASRKFGRGYIVTNPNCSTVALAMALAPLDRAFGVEAVMVTTMQAISGAGYPGVPSWDILDNVIPYIGGEEAKVETESRKILGRFESGRLTFAGFTISAQCHRVNVQDGHLLALAVKLKQKVSEEQVIESMAQFRGLPQDLSLPSAPAHPITVRNEADRPQPRRDRDTEAGMATIVGRIRRDPILDFKMNVLSHNTIRGAAGAAILNAELLAHEGYL